MRLSHIAVLTALIGALAVTPVVAQQSKPQPPKALGSSANQAPETFKTDDLVKSGHTFFEIGRAHV